MVLMVDMVIMVKIVIMIEMVIMVKMIILVALDIMAVMDIMDMYDMEYDVDTFKWEPFSPGQIIKLEKYIDTKAGLERAAEEVARARAGIDQALPLDLVAQHLRSATDELDALEGRTSPEDLLDRIFSRFCLGK